MQPSETRTRLMLVAPPRAHKRVFPFDFKRNLANRCTLAPPQRDE